MGQKERVCLAAEGHQELREARGHEVNHEVSREKCPGSSPASRSSSPRPASGVLGFPSQFLARIITKLLLALGSCARLWEAKIKVASKNSRSLCDSLTGCV